MMHRRGFTLIELLVFLAIFSVVMVAFTTMFLVVANVQTHQSESNEVGSQGQFLIQQIGYYIQSARLAGMPIDATTSILTLHESAASSSIDPTTITLATGTIYVQQGTGGMPLALTSSKVVISNLLFARHFNLSTSSAYGQDSISYSFTMTSNSPNAALNYSQSFSSSAAVLTPVPKIALLQQAKTENTNSGISLIAASFAGGNTTGSLLLAIVSNTGSTTSTVSVSDGTGNIWTKIADVPYATYSQQTNVFAAVNATGSAAANSVQASFSAPVNAPSIFIYEYRGASAASSFDASSTKIQTSSAAPSSGSANPSSSVELLFGVLYGNPSTEIPAPGTGYALETTSSISATYAEDQDVLVTGPVSAGWIYSHTTPNASALILTFK